MAVQTSDEATLEKGDMAFRGFKTLAFAVQDEASLLDHRRRQMSSVGLLA